MEIRTKFGTWDIMDILELLATIIFMTVFIATAIMVILAMALYVFSTGSVDFVLAAVIGVAAMVIFGITLAIIKANN